MLLAMCKTVDSYITLVNMVIHIQFGFCLSGGGCAFETYNRCYLQIHENKKIFEQSFHLKVKSAQTEINAKIRSPSTSYSCRSHAAVIQSRVKEGSSAGKTPIKTQVRRLGGTLRHIRTRFYDCVCKNGGLDFLWRRFVCRKIKQIVNQVKNKRWSIEHV